jgi:hypothetical protein
VGVLRVTPLQVIRSGARRVNRAPAVLLGTWIATLLPAIPMMLAVRSAIQLHLGASLEADTVASGANHDWMLEFGEQSSGVAATFGPSVIGFGVTLDNLSALVDGDPRPAAIVAVAAGSVLLWTFLSGGIIDRYARNRSTGSHGFFQACGGFCWPLLRLSVLSAVVYWVLVMSLRPWLLESLYDRLTRNVDAERTAIAVRATFYGVFVLSLAAFNLLFDYARVRLIVEDRLSAIGALRAGLAFIRRHWRGAFIIYSCNSGAFGLVLLAYSVVAPGAGTTGMSMWSGLAIGQCYIMARIWTKLLFWASEVEWFQSQLAHAGALSRPEPIWPEPAVVEQVVRPDSSEAAL